MTTQGTQHVLSGLRVLDFTRALAGPTCSRMLAEMGADVIKVESAPKGDLGRNFSTFGNKRSLFHVQHNRGKKSLCVNLRDPRGMALVTELIQHVDIVVENFKPGVMADMGLGYERLKEIKPDIILCSISALGQTGPLAHKPGYDYIAQAYSGVTSMIGEEDDAPYIPLVGMGDVSTGVHGALAVLAALRHRDNTGRGQHLDVGAVGCVLPLPRGQRAYPACHRGRHSTNPCGPPYDVCLPLRCLSRQWWPLGHHGHFPSLAGFLQGNRTA